MISLLFSRVIERIKPAYDFYRKVYDWDRINNQSGGLMSAHTKEVLEHLSKKCSQPAILEYEGWEVRLFSVKTLWFVNPDGEGTEVDKQEFIATIQDLFKRTF